MKTKFTALVIMFFSLVISSSVFAEGYLVTSDLWIKAVINTVEKGPVDAVFYNGGEKTTSRGDKVIWGYFYASPDDVSWGDQGNPDLYVKIWFDVSGRIDVNYFHVSVPDIDVYSDYPYDGAYDQCGTTTMDYRYVRHEYWQNGDNCEFAGQYTGTFSGDDYGTFSIAVDSQGNISGTAWSNKYQEQYYISGTISSSGQIYMVAGNVDTGATFRGSADSSGNVQGTWENPYDGDSGVFSGAEDG